MSRTSEIKIACEHRRCDTDSSGLELPNGRDYHLLWNWYVDGNESKWPGFFKEEDCINDMIKQNQRR